MTTENFVSAKFLITLNDFSSLLTEAIETLYNAELPVDIDVTSVEFAEKEQAAKTKAWAKVEETIKPSLVEGWNADITGLKAYAFDVEAMRQAVENTFTFAFRNFAITRITNTAAATGVGKAMSLYTLL